MRPSIPQLVLVAVLLSLATAASSQQTASPNPAAEPLIRKEFRNSPDLPDSIAFLTTLRFLESVNEGDSDLAVQFVEDGTGLEGIEAEEFLALLLMTLESAEDEMNEKKVEVCRSSAPKSPPQAYATFRALENVTEHVAAVRLHRLRAEIGPDKAQRLERWLDERKLETQYVEYNRKEMYRRDGRDPRERLNAICAALANTQSGGSQ